MTTHEATWFQSERTQLPMLLQQLSQYLQQTTLLRLSNTFGYQHLRLSFEAYIALIDPDGSKPIHLAQKLGVSKQSCNQIVKDIEAAGYLKRQPDPEDGRGKLLTLTPLGVALRKDGNDTVLLLEQQLQTIIGEACFKKSQQSFLALCHHFQVPLPQSRDRVQFSSLLFRLKDLATQRLFDSLHHAGHTAVKPYYGQVLSRIGHKPLTIGQMAMENSVSKQAIGAITTQLEKLSYISRRASASDRRQVFFAITPKGQQLMRDSSAAAAKLYADFEDVIGKKKMQSLEDNLRKVCLKLELLPSPESMRTPTDIVQMADQLIRDLGAAQAAILADQIQKRVQSNR